MSKPDPIQQLIHLRAVVVRLAHEVEAAADCVTGKGAPRARSAVSDVARRLRAAAMTVDMVDACRRSEVQEKSSRMSDKPELPPTPELDSPNVALGAARDEFAATRHALHVAMAAHDAAAAKLNKARLAFIDVFCALSKGDVEGA
jgi:hypothetical protein